MGEKNTMSNEEDDRTVIANINLDELSQKSNESKFCALLTKEIVGPEKLINVDTGIRASTLENFQNFNKRRRRLFRTLEYLIRYYKPSPFCIHITPPSVSFEPLKIWTK